ncbi:FecR family protein [Fibrella aquatica]|uniref:FecR family protein n=1 Tax=Fibrella aquatica TaxID=3242487 RepID=UPI0035218BE7
MLDYTKYTANEFALEQSFRQWILRKDAQSAAFWEAWVTEHPEKRETIELARRIVLSLRNAQEEISEEEIEVAVTKLVTTAEQRKPRVIPFFSRPWARVGVAASLLLVAFLGWLTYTTLTNAPTQLYKDRVAQLKQQTTINEVVTNNSQTRLVTLPDGSSVILRPNSRLSYPRQFPASKRSVFLSGEAFFEVAKNAQKPFFVYANEMVAKVVGTSFTIKAFARDKHVQVFVKSGKVAVFSQKEPQLKQENDAETRSGLLVLPRQQLTFLRLNNQFTKVPVIDAELNQLPAIQAQSFVFKRTSMAEVFSTLERSYPIKISYDASRMASCELTATLGDEPLAEKIALICKVIEADYEINGDIITILGKGCN